MRVEKKITAQTLLIDGIKKGKQENAIGFANWLSANYCSVSSGWWFDPKGMTGNRHNTEELYKLYLETL